MLRVDGVEKVFPRPGRFTRVLIRSATKEPVTALRHVDLHIDRGEVVGLVGPNGAGKTTLIKIISTLLEPTAGRVTVDGFSVASNPNKVRERIGLVLTDELIEATSNAKKLN